jgi:hypothetical protein
MTREQLEQKRDGLEAQMHWAALHHGEQELMDVLRDESERLAGMIGQYHFEADRQHRSSRAWTAWRAPPVSSSTSSMPSSRRVLASARSRTPGPTPRVRSNADPRLHPENWPSVRKSRMTLRRNGFGLWPMLEWRR